MTLDECYSLLGVSRDATNDELKKAFKKKAFECHPDKGGKQEDFQRLNEAYQVLSGKRKSSSDYGFQGPPPSTNVNDVDWASMFGDEFRFDFDPFRNVYYEQQRRNEPPPQSDRDITVNFSMTLEDVRKGRIMKAEVTKSKDCTSCYGVGGKSRSVCQICSGRGIIIQERRNGAMIFANSIVCRDCSGQGFNLTDACHECLGQGYTVYQEKVSISIGEVKIK